MIQTCKILIVISVFIFSSTSALAQPDAHDTSESARRGGYTYFWGVIKDEFDARTFDDPNDAARYRELVDIVIRTGATYSQPFRNSAIGLGELYPELLTLDPNPPLYLQYRYHSSQAQSGSDELPNDFLGEANALQRIAKEMEENQYPPYITGATWIRAAEFFRDAKMHETGPAQQARERGLDVLVQAASLEGVEDEAREFVADRLSKFGWRYSALVEEDKDLYCERLLTSATADPWIGNYAYGRLAYRRAWDARGSGWGYEVTDTQWAQFVALMDVSRRHLLKAWEHRPYWPVVPALLISVAQSHQIDDEKNEAFWFAETIQHRQDHAQAYKNYIDALMPRWGGTVEEMFALLDGYIESADGQQGAVYITIWMMARITWSEEDGHITLLNATYLNIATQMARNELEHPLPYKNKWQLRLVLRTLALGHYKLGNYSICAELLSAGGGMTDEVWSPWQEVPGFTRDAPLLASTASTEVIETLGQRYEDDIAKLKALKGIRKKLKKTPQAFEIMPTPLEEIEKRIVRLERRIPPRPFLSSPLGMGVAGGGVLLLVGFLFIFRMTRTSAA